MLVKTEKGTKEVGSLLEVTPENYIVPKGTEGAYHCRIEVVQFNKDTGERVSVPRIQIFGRKFFETFGLHNLKKQGYTVTILHDPKEWLAQKEADAKAAAEAKAAADAKAAEEARAAEREAVKAEILAELKAQGIIPDAGKPEEEKTTKSKSK